MMPTRRSLLLSAPMLLARPARANPSLLRLEPAGDGGVALTGSGVRRPLLLPARGARLLPPLACGGETLGLAAFVLADGAGALEWVAVALALDGEVALLALEPLAWHGADRARMDTRISASGDRRTLLCRRDTSVPAGPTLWRREAWTDYLSWTPSSGLRDAPVRAPLPGTRQHAVAQWRRRAAALVATGPAALTVEGFAAAGLQAASFSLAVSATPSMRQPSGRRIMV